VLSESGPLPVEDAVDYVLQACFGLAEAHALGFVHRDLKPGNLFVCHRADGTRAVKVIDFGIAKSLASGARLTSDSLVLGSPRYMSPEQLQSSKNVDERTDIWALGVILYRLLTGKAPFGGTSPGEILSAILSEPPRSIRELRSDLPDELAAAIEKCLAKKPEQRFQNVDELSESIATFASPRFRDISTRIAHVKRVRGSSRPPPPDRSALEQLDTVAREVESIPPPPASSEATTAIAKPSWPPASTSIPPSVPAYQPAHYPSSPPASAPTSMPAPARSSLWPLLLIGGGLLAVFGLVLIAGAAYLFGSDSDSFADLPVTDPTRVDAQQAFPAVKQFVSARDPKLELVSITVGDHVRGGLADLKRGDRIVFDFVNRATSAAVRVELEARGMRAVPTKMPAAPTPATQPACSTETAWRVLNQSGALSNREASFSYKAGAGRGVWTIVIADSPPITREVDGESCSVLR
jgi:hypothetical protein